MMDRVLRRAAFVGGLRPTTVGIAILALARQWATCAQRASRHVALASAAGPSTRPCRWRMFHCHNLFSLCRVRQCLSCHCQCVPRLVRAALQEFGGLVSRTTTVHMQFRTWRRDLQVARAEGVRQRRFSQVPDISPALFASMMRAVPVRIYEEIVRPSSAHAEVDFRGNQCRLVPHNELGPFADRFCIYYVYEEIAWSVPRLGGMVSMNASHLRRTWCWGIATWRVRKERQKTHCSRARRLGCEWRPNAEELWQRPRESQGAREERGAEGGGEGGTERKREGDRASVRDRDRAGGRDSDSDTGPGRSRGVSRARREGGREGSGAGWWGGREGRATGE